MVSPATPPAHAARSAGVRQRDRATFDVANLDFGVGSGAPFRITNNHAIHAHITRAHQRGGLRSRTDSAFADDPRQAVTCWFGSRPTP